jgi:hypothetical protein
MPIPARSTGTRQYACQPPTISVRMRLHGAANRPGLALASIARTPASPQTRYTATPEPGPCHGRATQRDVRRSDTVTHAYCPLLTNINVRAGPIVTATTKLPSWSCGFDSRHPLFRFRDSSLFRSSNEALFTGSCRPRATRATRSIFMLPFLAFSGSPASFSARRVNGHWEIRLGGLVFSGLAATSFPGWWPRVLPAGGG